MRACRWALPLQVSRMGGLANMAAGSCGGIVEGWPVGGRAEAAGDSERRAGLLWRV